MGAGYDLGAVRAALALFNTKQEIDQLAGLIRQRPED